MTALVRTLKLKPANGEYIVAGEGVSQMFQCPSDANLNAAQPGGYAGVNVAVQPAPYYDYFPASYGINIDITCLKEPNDGSRRTVYQDGQIIGVYKGNNSAAYGTPPGPVGDAAEANLGKVYKPAETLLIADCGVPPFNFASDLDRPDALFYTTNYMTYNGGDPGQWGTLKGILQTSWLVGRIPLNRHDRLAKNPVPGQVYTGTRGKINIVFVDGHAATVPTHEFQDVKVTPYSRQ
jgi:prepilin-type processing-associated H-X9-DG protein